MYVISTLAALRSSHISVTVRKVEWEADPFRVNGMLYSDNTLLTYWNQKIYKDYKCIHGSTNTWSKRVRPYTFIPTTQMKISHIWYMALALDESVAGTMLLLCNSKYKNLQFHIIPDINSKLWYALRQVFLPNMLLNRHVLI